MRELAARGLSPKRVIDKNAWRTPKPWVARVRTVFGGVIDLDIAASSNPDHWFADENIHLPDDGREVICYGFTYCNPPYGRQGGGIGSWTKRAAAGEADAFIMLTPPSTNSTYWHRDVWGVASRICFPAGRLSFIDPETGEAGKGNDTDSSFILWTEENEVARRFDVVFGEVGAVIHA